MIFVFRRKSRKDMGLLSGTSHSLSRYSSHYLTYGNFRDKDSSEPTPFANSYLLFVRVYEEAVDHIDV